MYKIFKYILYIFIFYNPSNIVLKLLIYTALYLLLLSFIITSKFPVSNLWGIESTLV